MINYGKGALLGEGASGRVHAAVDRRSGLNVAIKRIRTVRSLEGLDIMSVREIMFLQELRHENVVRLYEVFLHKGDICLAIELAQASLRDIIVDQSILLRPEHIKCYMQQLLSALAYCHENHVVHRDIKPDNLLLVEGGTMKLTDFGLCRWLYDEDAVFTPQAVTRWYRAPEMLFGAKLYTSAIDIWAVGCVMAELLLRTPYLAGESDLDQLSRIFAALGTPTKESWPNVSSLPDYVEFDPRPAPPPSMLFTAASPDTLELLAGLMKLDPSQRITAAAALRSEYFRAEPKPTPYGELPMPKGSSKPQ